VACRRVVDSASRHVLQQERGLRPLTMQEGTGRATANRAVVHRVTPRAIFRRTTSERLRVLLHLLTAAYRSVQQNGSFRTWPAGSYQDAAPRLGALEGTCRAAERHRGTARARTATRLTTTAHRTQRPVCGGGERSVFLEKRQWTRSTSGTKNTNASGNDTEKPSGR